MRFLETQDHQAVPKTSQKFRRLPLGTPSTVRGTSALGRKERPGTPKFVYSAPFFLCEAVWGGQEEGQGQGPAWAGPAAQAGLCLRLNKPFVVWFLFFVSKATSVLFLADELQLLRRVAGVLGGWGATMDEPGARRWLVVLSSVGLGLAATAMCAAAFLAPWAGTQVHTQGKPKPPASKPPSIFWASLLDTPMHSQAPILCCSSG